MGRTESAYLADCSSAGFVLVPVFTAPEESIAPIAVLVSGCS